MTEKKSGAQFRLRVKQGKSQWDFVIESTAFTLGRTEASTISIPVHILSSVHLEFSYKGDAQWSVKDKNSTNGTSLDGTPLDPTKWYQVKSPFQLRIGKNTDFQIEIEEKREAAKGIPHVRDTLKQVDKDIENDAAVREALYKEIAQKEAAAKENASKQELVLKEAYEKATHITAAAEARNKELEQLFHVMEAKISQSKSEEQLYQLQALEAKKLLDSVDERKRAEELKILEVHQAYEEKRVALYEISQGLESQRRDFDEQAKKIAHSEEDLRENEKKLEAKVAELKESDHHLVEQQRKINTYIEQENDIKKSVEAFKSEAEAYRGDRDEKKKLAEEMKKQIDGIETEFKDKNRILDELKDNLFKHENRLKETLEKESAAHRELHKSLKMMSDKENEYQTNIERIETIKKELDEKNIFLDKLNSQIDSLRRQQLEEEREHQILSNKLQMLKDTNQMSESQRKASEAALESVRAEIGAAEGRLKRMGAEASELDSRIEALRTEVASKGQRSQELEHSVRQLQDNEKKVLQEYNEKRNALKLELENYEKEEKERLNAEIVAKKAEIVDLEKSEKTRIRDQFSSQGEKLERDLNERKQKELIAMEDVKAKWNKEREARRPLEIKEIVRSVSDLVGAHFPQVNGDAAKKEALLSAFKRDVEGVVKSVLLTGQGAQVETHLKSMLVQSPEETLKAQKHRKVFAIQAGVATSALVICLIFPQIPRYLYDSGVNMVTRTPQSADFFVERIREARANRPKFMPQRDHVFRNTYTDNIIYLDDYLEIKKDDDLKKAWTLALNKYLLNKLDLDEKVIVTYMAIEGPLVKELSSMHDQIKMESKDADISRMREFEEMTKPRLVDVLKGEENYKKVRQFEMDFYNDYSKKLK